MLKFIFQKMLNKKWMTLSLFIGNMLLIAITCANPMYSQAVLQRTLTQELKDYLTENNRYPGAVTIKSSYSVYKEEADVRQEEAGRVFEEFLENIPVPILSKVTYSQSNVEMINEYKENSSTLQVAAYSEVEDHIKLTHGEMYSDQIKDHVIDVIVTEKGFVRQSLTMGQMLEMPKVQDENGIPYKIRVVGIFENKDAQDTYWENSPNDWVTMFLMDESVFSQVFSNTDNRKAFTRGWYAVLDYTQIKVGQVDHILQVTEKAQEAWDEMDYTQQKVYFKDTLVNFGAKEQKLDITITMLQIPTFLLLVIFIFMVSGQMLDMEQNEISVFKSRGASKGQIILLYFLQSVLIAGAGFVAGIPAGMMICNIIGASNAFLEFVQRTALPVTLNGESLLFGVAAAVLAVCTMVIPVLKLANASIVDTKRKKNRKGKRTWWKLIFLDVVLLAVSVYGLYQYKGQEAYLAEQAADGAALDPVLYACTSLFMLGAALFILRVLPWIIRITFEIGKKWWSPAVYASFLRILRTNNNQGFLVVFLVLTVAIGIFDTQTARSINANGEEQIRYSIGADVVLQELWEDNSLQLAANAASENPADLELTYEEPDFGKYQELDGIKQATKVLVDKKASMSVSGGGKLENVMVMGIHTKEFGETAWFKEALLSHHWYEYLNAISQDASAVLVSSNLQEKYGYKLGDIINYANANGDYTRGIIYGFVDYWPSYAPVTTVKGDDGLYHDTENFLIVAHLSQLQSAWGVTPYQVWINTNGSSQFLYRFAEENDMKFVSFQDASAELVTLKNESVFQGTNGVLTIGFLVVLLLCAVGFLIYWILSIQSRTLQFGIFRAMGMSKREILSMLVLEQVFISGTSIGGSVLTGWLVSKLFVPLLQIVYSSADRAIPLAVIAATEDYMRLGIVIGLMIIVCMVILGVLISKIKITQALKLGED